MTLPDLLDLVTLQTETQVVQVRKAWRGRRGIQVNQVSFTWVAAQTATVKT